MRGSAQPETHIVTVLWGILSRLTADCQTG